MLSSFSRSPLSNFDHNMYSRSPTSTFRGEWGVMCVAESGDDAAATVSHRAASIVLASSQRKSLADEGEAPQTTPTGQETTACRSTRGAQVCRCARLLAETKCLTPRNTPGMTKRHNRRQAGTRRTPRIEMIGRATDPANTSADIRTDTHGPSNRSQPSRHT